MNADAKQFYPRQTILAEIGEEGQEKLLQAKVAIVGCGGLGNAAAAYLAGSGIGELHLIDFDRVEASNLHRQVFYSHQDIGKPKCEVLAAHVKRISPHARVTYSKMALSKNSIFSELEGYDLLLDCTDSLPVKYLLNDYSVLNGKVLVYGSLYKHDGYVSTFNVAEEQGYTANLRDAFPAMPKDRVPNCSEIGTLNPIVGMIGILQANEVIKVITGAGRPLTNRLLIYNTMENSQFFMKLSSRTDREKIERIFASETYFDPGCHLQDPNLLIQPGLLRQKLQQGGVEILSVIDDTSLVLPFEVRSSIPASQFDVDMLETSPEKDLVVVCKKGISSYAVTRIIKEKHPHARVFSLEGGLEAYGSLR